MTIVENNCGPGSITARRQVGQHRDAGVPYEHGAVRAVSGVGDSVDVCYNLRRVGIIPSVGILHTVPTSK